MRRAKQNGRRVDFYHRVDDPYSHLLLQVLPALAARYPIEVVLHPVPAPPKDVDPQPDMRRAYAARDAQELASLYGLELPDHGEAPSVGNVRRANAALLMARTSSAPLETALRVGNALLAGDEPTLEELCQDAGPVRERELEAELASEYRELRDRGHYMGGMLRYEGEWYWGIDRLEHLTTRLNDEGLAAKGATPLLRPRQLLFDSFGAQRPVVKAFISFRSPYSYIAVARLSRLLERHDFELELTPVLPMLMRGFPMPSIKRMYIARDAKREADRHGVPFGRLCDPLGAVERCIALFPYARDEGQALTFVHRAMRGAWTEALDLSSDRDLKKVVRSSGLDWTRAQTHLRSDAGLALAEANRQELLAMGLWGVPSFRMGPWTAWGQDRLPLIEARIRAGK
jgi:2-hydroxychromene-2-carboxylate isomerase